MRVSVSEDSSEVKSFIVDADCMTFGTLILCFVLLCNLIMWADTHLLNYTRYYLFWKKKDFVNVLYDLLV